MKADFCFNCDLWLLFFLEVKLWLCWAIGEGSRSKCEISMNRPTHTQVLTQGRFVKGTRSHDLCPSADVQCGVKVYRINLLKDCVNNNKYLVLIEMKTVLWCSSENQSWVAASAVFVVRACCVQYQSKVMTTTGSRTQIFNCEHYQKTGLWLGWWTDHWESDDDEWAKWAPVMCQTKC